MYPHLIGLRGPGRYVPPGGGGGGEGDPGNEEPPTVVTDANGDVTVKGKIKPGSFGKIIVPLSAIAADRRYTFRVVANFSQMAMQGKLAMVGAGLKTLDSFHLVGLRGDGAAGVDEYIVHGTPPNGWNKQTGHTVVNGGDAASGTQHSAYYRLTISSDGTTYDMETGTDGAAWTSIFADQAITPHTNVSAVTTFGVALWFNNADTGIFSLTITEFLDEEAEQPLVFSFIEGKSQTTGSFAAVNFGAEDADRHIVIAAGAVDSGANVRTLTAVTIGGVSATLSANAGGSNFKHSCVAIAHVPTGLTGTVVVTTSGCNRFAIGVYRLVGLQSATAHDVDSVTGNGNALSIDIPAGGVCIAATGQWAVAAHTWSGVTEDYDVSPGSQSQCSTASKVSVAGETLAVDHQVNNSGTCKAAASYR